MTTYGTIDHPSPLPTSLGFLSHAKTRLETGLDSKRPWREMLNFSSFSIPTTFVESITRIQVNIAVFQINYVIIALFILFLSLFRHLFSLIIFAVTMIVWSYLHFQREDSVVLLGRVIDNRVMTAVLLSTTFVVLSLAGTIDNVVIGLLIAVVVVVLHAILRDTVDLLVEDAESGGSSSSSSSALPPSTSVQLRDTASDSYF